MKDVMLYSIRVLNLVKPDSIIDGVDSEVTVTVAASPSLGLADVLNNFCSKHKKVKVLEIIQIGLVECWDGIAVSSDK